MQAVLKKRKNENNNPAITIISCVELINVYNKPVVGSGNKSWLIINL